MCVHHRRLKTDRPVPPSAAPVTKDEENKEEDPVMQEVEDTEFVVDVTKDEENKEEHPATQEVEDNDLVVDVAKDEDEKKADPSAQEVENNDFMVDAAKHEENKETVPATQEVQENDFVVGLDPGSTNILAIAAPKRAEDGTDGKLRQKDMRVLKLSNARYYRESGTMNARKKTETWNSGMKEHLEAMSEVTSRGADFTAFGNSWKFVLLIGRRCGRSIQSPCELVCV